MTISRIAHMAEPKLTRQQLADMAVTEWQEARRAFQRDDKRSGDLHKAEALRLATLAGE